MKRRKSPKQHTTRKHKGFSLIELLIVVAIILIIAAIAIPNFLRSRIAANEASAVASLHTLDTAEITYNTTYPSVGFTGLAALGPVSGGASPTSAAARPDRCQPGERHQERLHVHCDPGQRYTRARLSVHGGAAHSGNHRTALLLQRHFRRDPV